eukprot:scaffold119878_cov48-Phaeocystis_antarctica.AAC.4
MEKPITADVKEARHCIVSIATCIGRPAIPLAMLYGYTSGSMLWLCYICYGYMAIAYGYTYEARALFDLAQARPAQAFLRHQNSSSSPSPSPSPDPNSNP